MSYNPYRNSNNVNGSGSTISAGSNDRLYNFQNEERNSPVTNNENTPYNSRALDSESAVTGSKLAFSSVSLTNLTEDSFLMKVSGEVTNTGPLAATIEVPDGVSVSWENLLIGNMPLDTISAAPFVGARIESTQTFKISNKTAFSQFNKFMLTEKEFTWHLEGVASVKAAGLNLQNIVLSKDITMGDPQGGIVVQIVSTMGNPSPISVQLGDLTFDIQYLNHTIGEVSATNITLLQGDNKLNLNGRLIPQNTTDSLAAVSDLFSKFIAGQNATTDVVAKLVKPDNNTEPVSWLQSAFLGTRLSVVLAGPQNLSVITGVTINTLDLDFLTDNPYIPMAASPSLTASFSIPFGFPLSMKKISQDITMFDGATNLAKLSTPYTDASGNTTTGIIKSSFAPTPFQVTSGSENAFDDFSKKLTTDPKVDLVMKGVANSIASTPVGDVEIKGIKFSVNSSLDGLQGLKTKAALVNSLKVVGGTTDMMLIDLSVTLFNPSNVKINMGDINFDLYFKEKQLGKVLMKNYVLDRGENTGNVVAQFAPKTDDALKVGRDLLNNFMAGKPNDLGIQGTLESTTISSLKKALSSLELETSMPGLKSDKNVILKARFAIGLNTIFDSKGTASIDAFNPLDTTIKFLKIQSTITSEGNLIGTIDEDLTSAPVVIEPKQSVTTKDFELKLKITPAALKSLFESIKGDLFTDISSTILVAIGDYQTTIDYVSTGLGKGGDGGPI
nr:8518_t:CDS:2 [Entrophospora candida]